MRKLYISDLDGTLLRNDATLSDYTRKKLCKILEAGTLFTIASARSIHSIRPILNGLPLTLPVIEFNGAFISDLCTGEHKLIQAIQGRIAAEILSFMQGHGLYPFISSFNRKEDCLYYQEITNPGMNWYFMDRLKNHDPRLRQVRDLNLTLDDQIICFTLINREEALKDLFQELKENFKTHVEMHFYENPYSPGWHWLTIHDRLATKDQAIKVLLRSLGMDAGNLIVFGDDINDLKMFKLAGRAVAVRNARNQLKETATEIIGINEEDSVVDYIASSLSHD